MKCCLLLALLVGTGFAQHNYPFGWTPVGQARGFSSLCRGDDPSGEYASNNFGIITSASWADGVVTLNVTKPNSYLGYGYPIYVSGITPNGFNGGPFTMTNSSPNTGVITYALASNPGSYISGGIVTTFYSFGCHQIVPWSGGVNALDSSGNPIFCVLGGGHSDYAGNEVNCISGLTGASGTATWTEPLTPVHPVPFTSDGLAWEGLCPPPYASQSFVAEHFGGIPSATCGPGVQVTPSSRHTYGGLVFNPSDGLIYMFGGGHANTGGFSNDVWTLNPTSWAWTLLRTQLSTGGGLKYGNLPGTWAYITAYNPSNGHILVHDEGRTLYDFNPSNNRFTRLIVAGSETTGDGWTAVVDPVNNLFVSIGAWGGANNCSYPCKSTSQNIEVWNLTTKTQPKSWYAGSDCDLIYRNAGIDYDSKLGLIVIYPGGGHQVELLNSNPNPVVTHWGTIASHHCLDVTLSLKAGGGVKGVDYPQDPEGIGNNSNLGLYGRFRYLAQSDSFIMVNARSMTAWVASLTLPDESR